MKNSEKLETACRLILEAIGEDPEREGLKDTPRRFAKSWQELTEGYNPPNPETFSRVFAGEDYDEMIVVKDIEFFSLCEHHLLPIAGTVSVGYIPDQKIIGLSKIPRIVDIISKRVQNQERITSQVADTLMEMLKPKGVGVQVSASHMCMTMRGVKKHGSKMDTSAVRGFFRNDPKTRAEFFDMIRKS